MTQDGGRCPRSSATAAAGSVLQNDGVQHGSMRAEQGGGGHEGESKWGFPVGNAHALRIRQRRTTATAGKAVVAGRDAHLQ
jgi:hypothetical protein